MRTSSGWEVFLLDTNVQRLSTTQQVSDFGEAFARVGTFRMQLETVLIRVKAYGLKCCTIPCLLVKKTAKNTSK